MARAAVRTAAHSEADPVPVLCTVNEVLHRWFAGRTSFVTAAYATFTPPAPGSPWRVTVASGGHPPGYVRRAGGRVEQLGGGGRVLGLLAESSVDAEHLQLWPGDSLVLHTDGISEAHRIGDGDQLDEAGVVAALESAAPGATADRLAEMLADAADTQAGTTTADDTGVVVVQIG
jgi:serine phosphatase RsbU (regulator of sigma subunit)